MRSRSTLISRLLCILVVASLSSIAHGQADIEKRVRTMNKQAMADYDSLEFDMARTTLLDAVSLIRQNGLTESAVAAKTYLNLGVVYVAGFKDRNRGLQQFVAALRINPQAHLNPAVATPELDEIFAAAQKQVGASSTPTPKPTPKPTPVENPPQNNTEPLAADDVKGLAHTAPEEAQANAPLTLKAQLGSDTGATRVFIMYRSSGQADYVSIPMSHAQGAEWIGVIPGEAVGDRPLQYYLEARDKRGRTVIGSGSAPNPYIVTIAENVPRSRTETVASQPAHEKAKFHHVFLFVMPGFGIGYHPAGNRTEIAYYPKANSSQYAPTAVDKPGGVAIAPFHLAIEVGGLITNHFSLSAVGRFQVATGADAQTQPNGSQLYGASTRATGAVAGYLRARYRFLDGKVHPYLTFDIGGGEIRHALNLANAQAAAIANGGSGLVDAATAAAAANNTPLSPVQTVCPAKGSCYDSLKMGYLFVGAGFGVWYDVWKYIALIADVNVLGAVGVGPGGQSGMNIDIQLGVGAHFL